MIQFNLLPDVKLAYIKSQRVKKLTISISIIASAVALFVFISLFLVVSLVQKKNMSDLTADIKTQTSDIQKTKDLDKLLTVQNQLGSLSSLHSQKPSASRLYAYLGQVTPSNVTISNATVNFTESTISITGEGPGLDGVNTFVDTLKFTTFTTDKNDAEQKPFKDVVLSNFTREEDKATYTISLSFDPLIFDVTNKVTLTVPSRVTTRSVTEQPIDLFKQSTVTPEGVQ